MGRYLITIMAAASMWLASPTAYAAGVLRVAYEDKEQSPNYLGNGTAIDTEKPGISVEIVKQAVEDLGLTVEFSRLSWARCLADLKSGRVDAIFNSSYVKERLEFGVYPGHGETADPALRITTIEYSLYRMKGSAVGWDGETFAGITAPVGAVIGYSIIAELKKRGLTVDEAASSEVNLRKLANGRIAAAALQAGSADQMLKTSAFATIEKIKPPLVTKDYFVMMSPAYVKADPALADRIWAKIGALRDPMTARLAAKYAD